MALLIIFGCIAIFVVAKVSISTEEEERDWRDVTDLSYGEYQAAKRHHEYLYGKDETKWQ